MASRTAAVSLACVALMSIPARAFACGASSGGVAGVSACSLSEHEEETRSKWHVGASYSFTSTAIRFDGNTEPEEQRDGVAISVAYRPSLRWTLEAGAGPLFGGHLRLAQTYAFRPGLLATLGASFRILDALDARPFVLLTGQGAFVAASTRDPASSQSTAYDAFDIRLGAVAGWTIWNVLSPYAVVRAFGGPVYWTYQGRSVVGTDTHHYQVGLGASVLIARSVDVFVEGIPLGEQAISAGAGLSF